jgi:DNA-binding protein HU-beta
MTNNTLLVGLSDGCAGPALQMRIQIYKSRAVYYTGQRLTTCNPLSSIGFRPVGGTVIKLDIVNAIVQKTNITRTKAEQAVETVFEAMKNALGRGERIELRRFGVFNVKPRKTGIGRNPRTGQQVSIPPGKAVRFKPGKELQSLPATAAAPKP